MRTSAKVGGLLVILLAACSNDSEGTIDGVVEERVGEYTHLLADLDYGVPMPSGGDHPPAPYWLTCGIYDGEIPEELAVHSLEHGAVWIGIGPDATDADRAAAAALADLKPGRVIVSDVPGLDHPVELVAWGFRFAPPSASDESAREFVEQYTDRSTAPEAGASCQSVGEPPTPPTLPTG